jgi:hypothetical protein
MVMTDEQLDAALALLQRQRPVSVCLEEKLGGEVEPVEVEAPARSKLN